MAKITTQNIKNKKTGSENTSEDTSLYGSAQRFSQWAEDNAKLLVIGFMGIVVVCVLTMAFSAYRRSQSQSLFQEAYTIERNFSDSPANQTPANEETKKLSPEKLNEIHQQVLGFMKAQPASAASRNLAIKWVSQLFDQKDYDKALEVIQAYQGPKEGLSGLNVLLKGSTLMQAKKYPEAIKVFQSVLDNKTWAYLHSEAIYQKSFAQVKSQDFDGAIASLKQLHEDFPQDQQAYGEALKIMRWLQYQKAQGQ